MRYFFENLVDLQPQNLIPEVIWVAVAVYLLTLIGCYASLFKTNTRSSITKLAWAIVLLIPFLGPILYASACIRTSDSGWTEFLQLESNRGNTSN